MVIGEVRRRFWLGELMERNPMKDLGVDGRIILQRIGFTDWIDLAQDRKS